MTPRSLTPDGSSVPHSTTPHAPTTRVRWLWPAVFAAAAAAATAACGNLNGHTDAPSVLATVQGQLTFASSMGTIPDDVHIAVIWQTSTLGQFNVTEDLPVQAGFPSQYTLPLTEPPPAAALEHSSNYPGIAGADGVVVAYEDLNGNGRLDLVADDAGAFVDRIVAGNSNLGLIYYSSTTGSLPDFAASLPSPPKLGYNVVTQSCIPLDGGFRGPDGGFCDWNVYLPISTPYDLIFSDDPTLNSLMCGSKGYVLSSGWSAGGSSGSSSDSDWNVSENGTPPSGYPEAGICSSDKRTYQTGGCQLVQETVCTSVTECTSPEDFVLDPDASMPPDWPCP
jgi:hypothetical protein